MVRVRVRVGVGVRVRVRAANELDLRDLALWHWAKHAVEVL